MGFFVKQGFARRVTAPQDLWAGHLKVGRVLGACACGSMSCTLMPRWQEYKRTVLMEHALQPQESDTEVMDGERCIAKVDMGGDEQCATKSDKGAQKIVCRQSARVRRARVQAMASTPQRHPARRDGQYSSYPSPTGIMVS